MPKLREYKVSDTFDIVWVITQLKAARTACKRIGANQTLKKIRSALKSAEGAQRHINSIKNRNS